MPAPTPNLGALIWFPIIGPLADILTVHESVGTTGGVANLDNYSATQTTSDGQVIENVKFLNNFSVRHRNVVIQNFDTNGKQISSPDNMSTPSVKFRWGWIRALGGGTSFAIRCANASAERCEISGYRDGFMHKYAFMAAVECLLHSPLDTYDSFFVGKPLPNSHPDLIQLNGSTTDAAYRMKGYIERCGIYSWPWHCKRTSASAPINVDGVPLKNADNNPSYWRAHPANDALACTAGAFILKPEGGNLGSEYFIFRDSYVEGHYDNGIYVNATKLGGAKNQGVVIADIQVRKFQSHAGSEDGQGYAKTRWCTDFTGQTIAYGRVVDADTGAAIAPSGYSTTPAPPPENIKSYFDTNEEIDPDRVSFGGEPGGGGGGGGTAPVVTIDNPTEGATLTAPFTFNASTDRPGDFAWAHLYVRRKGTVNWLYVDKDAPTNSAFSFATVSADGMVFTDRNGIIHNFPPGEVEFRAEFEQSTTSTIIKTVTATVGTVVAPPAGIASTGTLEINLSADVVVIEPSGYVDPRQVRWVKVRSARPDYDEHPINTGSGLRVVHDGVGYLEVI